MLGLKEFADRVMALRADKNATAADISSKVMKPLAISTAITVALCLVFAVMPGLGFE